MEVSAADLVCLHLDAVERERAATTATAVLPGMPEVLDLGGTVDEAVDVRAALDSLTSDGLAERVVQTVGETDQQRTAYRLTAAGRDRAAELRAGLEAETVTVTNGGSASVRLAEMARYLEDRPLVTALAGMEEGGTVTLPWDPEAARVSRTAELERLEERMAALESGGGQAVLLTGPAGVGKTAVVDAFLETLDDDVQTARAQCRVPATRPYDVFRQVFDDLPQVPGLDRLVTDVPTLPRDERTLETRRQLLFADVGEPIREAAADSPLVLVLEDLQWADDPSLELLRFLLGSVAGGPEPVLLVGTLRPQGADGELPEQLRLAVETTPATRRSLDPLDAAAIGQVLRDALGTDQLPERVVEAVTEHTGGNPLFATEVGWLLEGDGVLRPAEGCYPSDEDIAALPESVEGVASDRVAELDTDAVAVLELGAVVGDRLPWDILLVASERSGSAVLAAVAELVERAIWRREGTDLAFVHSPVREAVLDGLAADREAALHGRVAAAVDAGAAADPAAQYRRLAFHARRAGERDRAIDASLAAADRANEVHAHELAVDAARQASNLAREAGRDEALLEALELLGDAFHVTGDFERARHRFSEVRERVESGSSRGSAGSHQGMDEVSAPGDGEPADPRIQRMLRKEGLASLQEGAYDAAAERFDRALSEAAARRDREAVARNHLNRGSVANKRGDLGAAREAIQESLAICREIGATELAADARNELGVIARKEGDYETAESRYRDALASYRDLDDRNQVGKVLTNLGVVSSRLGDVEDATANYRQALEIYRDCGDRHKAAVVRQNLGIIAAKEGDVDLAREHFEAAIDRFRTLGDMRQLARTRNNLAMVERQAWNLESARERFREALDTFRDLGDAHSEAKCRNNLGVIARRTGDTGSARAYHERARSLAREIEAPEILAQSTGYLGAVAIAEGDLAAGRAQLEEALETLRGDEVTPVELAVVRQHLEAEVDRGNLDRARDLCAAARSRMADADASLGHEGDRIETICETIQAG